MFGLDNQNSTLGNTSFMKAPDCANQGGIHVEIAREWKIENGSISQA
jgi:hypothetical protein